MFWLLFWSLHQSESEASCVGSDPLVLVSRCNSGTKESCLIPYVQMNVLVVLTLDCSCCFFFFFFFFFYCLILSLLPVISPKVQTIQQSVFTVEQNQVQFDPDPELLLCSEEPSHLMFRFRLKSLELWTEPGVNGSSHITPLEHERCWGLMKFVLFQIKWISHRSLSHQTTPPSPPLCFVSVPLLPLRSSSPPCTRSSSSPLSQVTRSRCGCSFGASPPCPPHTSICPTWVSPTCCCPSPRPSSPPTTPGAPSGRWAAPCVSWSCTSSPRCSTLTSTSAWWSSPGWPSAASRSSSSTPTPPGPAAAPPCCRTPSSPASWEAPSPAGCVRRCGRWPWAASCRWRFTTRWKKRWAAALQLMEQLMEQLRRGGVWRCATALQWKPGAACLQRSTCLWSSCSSSSTCWCCCSTPRCWGTSGAHATALTSPPPRACWAGPSGTSSSYRYTGPSHTRGATLSHSGWTWSVSVNLLVPGGPLCLSAAVSHLQTHLHHRGSLSPSADGSTQHPEPLPPPLHPHRGDSTPSRRLLFADSRLILYKTITMKSFSLLFLLQLKNCLLLLATLRGSTDPVMYFLLDKTFHHQTLVLLGCNRNSLRGNATPGSDTGSAGQKTGQLVDGHVATATGDFSHESVL